MKTHTSPNGSDYTMIIHHPEKTIQETHTILWARIDLDTKVERFPEFVWYRVPNRYAEYFSLRSDAFLIPALVAAMHFGEDIRVRGTVSPRLAYHLDEYQFIQKFQFPREVHKVAVHYECLAPLKAPPLPTLPTGVGVGFSGGVDSFFTLLKHMPENQPSPDYQVTHALFVNGFDMMVQSEKRKYEALTRRFQGALNSINVELVPIETNAARMIFSWLRFNYYYSPTLAGCAMSLAGLFKRFIISNSWDYYQLQTNRHTSNPLSDRLLSTETLEYEHFGANYRRVEKVKAISDWQLAQEHLRVCGHSDQLLNCSRCGKCIRTMLPIYALGKMEHFETFTKPLRSDRDVLRWARKFDPYPEYTLENYAFLRKHKPSLLPWLSLTIGLGYLRNTAILLLPGFIKKWLQRYGHFIDHREEENAFENLEISAAISSQYCQQTEERIIQV